MICVISCQNMCFNFVRIICYVELVREEVSFSHELPP